MALHLTKPNVPMLVVAMAAMVLSAAGQSSDRSIIFSTPKTDDAQAATPSLSPQNSQLPVLPGSLQAPDPAFNFRAPNDLPELPPTGAGTPQAQRMKKLLEERKNWTLMTPEEILGVTPADELLQPPERDAAGREKKQTQLERYLERENRPRGGLTNGWQHDQDNSPWNFSRDRDRNGLNSLDPGRDSMIDAAQRLNEYLNNRRIGDAPVNRNDKNFGWDSFSPPAPQPTGRPDLEQMAAMERFRQLLQPSQVPAMEPVVRKQIFPCGQKPPGFGSQHQPAGFYAESGRRILHSVDDRNREADRFVALAGNRDDGDSTGSAAGLGTAASPVAFAGSAAVCDAAAEILKAVQCADVTTRTCSKVDMPSRARSRPTMRSVFIP